VYKSEGVVLHLTMNGVGGGIQLTVLDRATDQQLADIEFEFTPYITHAKVTCLGERGSNSYPVCVTPDVTFNIDWPIPKEGDTVFSKGTRLQRLAARNPRP